MSNNVELIPSEPQIKERARAQAREILGGSDVFKAMSVDDLLKAVFDANLHVMKVQTDSYIKLMKEATKSTADFIKKVKDDESFARLAESRSDQYNVATEKAADGSTKL